MKRKTWNRILACVLALVMLVSTVIYDGSRSKAEGDGDNPADQTVDQTADQLGTQTADQTSNQTGTISIEIPAEAKDYTWSYKLDENEYATGTVASAGSGDDAVYRVEVPDVTAGDHSLTIKVNDGTNDYVSGSQSIAVTAGEATKYSAALNSDGGTYKVNLTEVVPPAPPVSKYEVKAAVTGADGYSGGVLNYKDASDASATYAQVPSEGLAAGTYTFQYVGAAGYQLAGEGATKTEDSDAGKANWKTTITYESVAISANKTFNITATPIYEVSVTGGAVKYTDGTEKTITACFSLYLK